LFKEDNVMTHAPAPGTPSRNVKIAVAILVGLLVVGTAIFILVRRSAVSLSGGEGFLGTRAGLFADLNLIAEIVLLVGLFVGFVLVRTGNAPANRQNREAWIAAHQYNQTTWVLFNLVLTLFIMAMVFFGQVAPEMPDNLRDAYGLVSTLHAVLGMVTVVCGVYILLRMNKLLPKALRVAWWKNLMRGTLALYWVVGLFGLGTYYVWYIQPAPAAAIPTPAPTPEGGAPQGGVVDVFLSSNTFVQPEITIPVGTKVVFHNIDPRRHTVTFDNNDFPAKELGGGATHEITFDAVGDYAYFCEFHGGPGGVDMAGVIHVTESAELPTAAPSPTPVPTNTPAPTATITDTPAPPTPTEVGAPTATPADTPTPGPSPTPEPAIVIMQNFEFAPKEITVKAGQEIVFVIQEGRHGPYLSFENDTGIAGFDSGTLSAGQQYPVTFRNPGTYFVRCGVHPNEMLIKITVEP
jgi:plastocyanin